MQAVRRAHAFEVLGINHNASTFADWCVLAHRLSVVLASVYSD